GQELDVLPAVARGGPGPVSLRAGDRDQPDGRRPARRDRAREPELIVALLEIKDLRVEIPRPGGILHPVRGVDFELGLGQTRGIVGEAGSGKSLTALALMGLAPAQARVRAGALKLDG